MKEKLFSEFIEWEAKAWEKRTGKRPTALVLSNEKADLLFLETYNFIMKKEEAKFENPKNKRRQFMGMDLVVMKITYGGSFDWGFAE